MRDELEIVRQWARAKIDAGTEPPWAWYQYMKLVETCDAILTGMTATVTSPGAHLQLVDATYPQDVSQLPKLTPAPAAGHYDLLVVQMPM